MAPLSRVQTLVHLIRAPQGTPRCYCRRRTDCGEALLSSQCPVTNNNTISVAFSNNVYCLGIWGGWPSGSADFGCTAPPCTPVWGLAAVGWSSLSGVAGVSRLCFMCPPSPGTNGLEGNVFLLVRAEGRSKTTCTKQALSRFCLPLICWHPAGQSR